MPDYWLLISTGMENIQESPRMAFSIAKLLLTKSWLKSNGFKLREGPVIGWNFGRLSFVMSMDISKLFMSMA